MFDLSDHIALCIICGNDRPRFKYSLAEALRLECALNVSVLMPASDIILTIHLASVAVVTGW